MAKSPPQLVRVKFYCKNGIARRRRLKSDSSVVKLQCVVCPTTKGGSVVAEHTVVISKRKVLASSSIVFVGDGPIAISGPQFSVVIRFQEDPPSPQPKQEAVWEVVDGVLTATLKNWANPLGTALESRIGLVDGTPLVMALFVHSIATTTSQVRHLSYTFSVGEYAA